MITIDEKTLGLWNVPLPDRRSDWLAAVRELVPDEKYQLDYRFRYYADDKVFESEDRKSWYRGELSGTRHYVLESIRAVARRMASVAGSEVSEFLNDGDMKAFMEKIANGPSMYMRRT